MMSPKAIKSAAQAGHYFEHDDYYVDGLSPSGWVGSGAAALGLSGDVDRETFRALLEGQLPDGQRLGTVRDGEWKHQPGIDLTFSAPKSVSILAEVAGDQRLLEAHDEAVKATLRYIEQEYIITRNRNRAENTVDYEKTASIVAATFKHTTSRALDPFLHTHSVVMNATQRADGQWRSIENKPLFIDQKHLGLVYRQNLAVRTTPLGYEIEHGKDGSWEIRGVPEELIDQYSKRSQAIEGALEGLGKTRDTATAAEKETATLDTRDRKVHAERGELLERWYNEIGGDKLNELKEVIAQSKANQPTVENKTEALLERVQLANEAVMWAAEHLGERNTSWSRNELLKEASRYAGSRVVLTDVQNAIDAAASDGLLQEKSVRIYDKVSQQEVDVRGYTSKAAIVMEDEMLKEEYIGRNRAESLCSQERAVEAIAKAEEKANTAGYEWNPDQKRATEGILTSKNRIIGVQGLAGTAKTTSVLRTVAETAREMGYEVRGLTPTNSAGQSLTDGAGIQSGTIQSFLAQNRNEWVQERKTRSQIDKIDKRLDQLEKALINPGTDEKTGVRIPENSPLYQKRLDEYRYEKAELQAERKELGKMLEKTPQLWIVDESSMVGTKLMRDLLQRAGQSGVRVVLTGDVRQLASVEAGAGFRQLQNHGMETYHLEEIVRQTNRGTRDAVYLSLMKKAKQALDRIQESGSVIKEMVAQKGNGKIDHEKSGGLRREELVKDYMALSLQDREKSAIIEPTRKGRKASNDMVRDAMKIEGSLGKEITVHRLSSVDATEAELRINRTYQEGQIVRFTRSFKREGIKQGAYYEIVGHEGKSVLLKPHGSDELTESIRFSPERYSAKNVQIFNLAESGLAVGDKIVWRDNDRTSGRVNNDFATVAKIEGATAIFRLSNGETREFDMSKLKNSHWDHGYAMTGNGSQGKTFQNVLANAETKNNALLNNEQLYVQISRATDKVYLYTDSREGLIKAVEQRTGQKQAAKESRFQNLAPLDHLMDKLWDPVTPQSEQQKRQKSSQQHQGQGRDRGGIELSR